MALNWQNPNESILLINLIVKIFFSEYLVLYIYILNFINCSGSAKHFIFVKHIGRNAQLEFIKIRSVCVSMFQNLFSVVAKNLKLQMILVKELVQNKEKTHYKDPKHLICYTFDNKTLQIFSFKFS